MKHHFKTPLLTALLVLGSLTAQAQTADKATSVPVPTSWKGTWATAVEYTTAQDMPKASLSNRSLRQTVHVSMGGDTLRLKLSNEFGDQPTEILSVYIAEPVGEDCAINPKSAKYLKFAGKKNVTLPSGEAVCSDPLAYPLKSGQLLSITINYGKATPLNATSHRGSRTTSYIIPGESKPATPFTDCEKVDHWYNLSAIDIVAPDTTPIVAVLGNSITDGRGSTTNKQNRWTDILANQLNAVGDTTRQASPWGVLNLGIGGNCVVEGGISEPAIWRFDRDILGQSGLTHLIIFEGTNDIGTSQGGYEQLADTLLGAYRDLAARAKSKGIKVYLATITPNKGNGWYSLWHEAVRQTVNENIRKNGFTDGIIDFDLLTRDNGDDQRLKDAYSDDWLHLNPLGYEAMGKYAAERLLEDNKVKKQPYYILN